jgi:hypothetical protein
LCQYSAIELQQAEFTIEEILRWIDFCQAKRADYAFGGTYPAGICVPAPKK